MGHSISKVWNRLKARKPTRFLFLGLDAAGKTTIVYKLKLGEVITTMPTIGFNVEQVTYKNITLTAWDVGGRGKIRPLWRHYYKNTDAIIFVVDSNDQDRIDDSKDYEHSAKEELFRTLAEDELVNVPLLVFANKQDLPRSMKIQEITKRLGLDRLRNRKWYIQGTCAVTGDGLYEGLDWLMAAVNEKLKSDKSQVTSTSSTSSTSPSLSPSPSPSPTSSPISPVSPTSGLEKSSTSTGLETSSTSTGLEKSSTSTSSTSEPSFSKLEKSAFELDSASSNAFAWESLRRITTYLF